MSETGCTWRARAARELHASGTRAGPCDSVPARPTCTTAPQCVRNCCSCATELMCVLAAMSETGCTWRARAARELHASCTRRSANGVQVPQVRNCATRCATVQCATVLRTQHDARERLRSHSRACVLTRTNAARTLLWLQARHAPRWRREADWSETRSAYFFFRRNELQLQKKNGTPKKKRNRHRAGHNDHQRMHCDFGGSNMRKLCRLQTASAGVHSVAKRRGSYENCCDEDCKRLEV